ncbi:hypothetical protein BASA60_011141 [Batrachochytrium salamandrivorans]|nr:hypothetical protein BASA60_011141 [Batrachochytrium salamandrivorans]
MMSVDFEFDVVPCMLSGASAHGMVTHVTDPHARPLPLLDNERQVIVVVLLDRHRRPHSTGKQIGTTLHQNHTRQQRSFWPQQHHECKEHQMLSICSLIDVKKRPPSSTCLSPAQGSIAFRSLRSSVIDCLGNHDSVMALIRQALLHGKGTAHGGEHTYPAMMVV